MFDKLTSKREKVVSTAFGEFVRNASSRDKKKLLDKVVQETILEQREMIAKAKQLEKCA